MIAWRIYWTDFRYWVRHWWQKLTRGYSDAEWWNLDASIARYALPRLKATRERAIGYPANMTPETWNEALDKMIYAFEYYAGDARFECDDEATRHRVQVGLFTFCVFYRNLWD